MLEIFVEDGLFKIVAQQYKGQLCRTLEMSRQDGLKVLKTMFQGDVNQLVSSIQIEDKLHIKGLEDFEI